MSIDLGRLRAELQGIADAANDVLSAIDATFAIVDNPDPDPEPEETEPAEEPEAEDQAEPEAEPVEAPAEEPEADEPPTVIGAG